MTTIRVIAAAVQASGAVFYTESGESVTLPATDPQTARLVEIIHQALLKNPDTPVEVDLTNKIVIFREIEKSSGGLVRFFRVAKSAVNRILGRRADRGTVNPGGMVQLTADIPVLQQPGTEDVTPEIVQQLEAAVETHHRDDDSQTTVAVVGDTPIVGVEALEAHAHAAVAQDNSEGFTRFMQRLAAIAKTRKHTAQELVAFLKKNDLPIANDGSILVYKSLTKTSRKTPEGLDIFIDNHSRTFDQTLGTRVEMDAEMVDDNRRVECSNGFHVGRRGYFSGYGTSSDNGVFLAKVAPEDVISVPFSERDKMRVCAYDLVAYLPDAQKERLSANQSLDKGQTEVGALMGRVIRGTHAPITHRTYRRKGDKIVQLESLVQASTLPVPEIAEQEPLVAQSVEEYLPKEQVQPIVPLNPAKINKEIKQGVSDADRKAAKAARDKASKAKRKAEKQKAAQPPKVIEKESVEVKTISQSSIGDGMKTSQVSLKKMPESVAKLPEATEVPMTQVLSTKERGRQLYEAWVDDPSTQNLDALVAFKKSKKKHWDALGLTYAEHQRLTEALENRG